MKRHSVPFLLVLTLVGVGMLASAQDVAPQFPQSAQQQQQPQAQQNWTPDQLNNLVSPVALYPDPLLGQILVAATYPLEVVEANQWLQANRNLTGQALMDGAKQQPWDPSIQALVAVPDALAKLNQDIRWTTDLGNAFLAQQSDVMAAVQSMRGRAQSNGRLESTPQQTVSTQYDNGQQAIVIQPASPEVIYVPSYDPYYVWGAPSYGYYPRLHYSSWGFGFGRGWSLGYAFGGWGGWDTWGWGPSWFGGGIYVNPYFFSHYGYRGGFYGRGYYGGGGRTFWAHDASHRLGVGYGNSRVAARFNSASVASRGTVSRGAAVNNTSRGFANTNGGAQRYSNNYANRSFQQGQQASRNYSAPSRNYSAPARNFSAPSRSSAPSSSAPRSSGGGGGHVSGGGGGHSSGGGGGSHGGGGGHRG